jgi:hypothetical protein
MTSKAKGKGTPDDAWRLKAPPQTSDFTMRRDKEDGKDVLVCTVGKAVLLSMRVAWTICTPC